jgi:hypothetical protein
MTSLANGSSLQPSVAYRTAWTLERSAGAEAIEQARDIVLDWIRERCRAIAGLRFDESGFYDGPAYCVRADRFSAIVVEPPDASSPDAPFAARVEMADRHDGPRTIDIGLHASGADALLEVRLTRRTPTDLPFFPEVPGFVRAIARDVGAYDGSFRVTSEPHAIVDVAGVAKLVEALLDRDRRLAVFVASEPYAVDLRALAQEAYGAAHVVALIADMTFALTDAIGRDFSVFGGAVRTYRPALDRFRDDRSRHPLMMPATISEYAKTRDVADLILERLFRAGVGSGSSGPIFDVDTLRDELRAAPPAPIGGDAADPAAAAAPGGDETSESPVPPTAAEDARAATLQAQLGDERRRNDELLAQIERLQQINESFENDWMEAQSRVEELARQLEQQHVGTQHLDDVANPAMRRMLVAAQELWHQALAASHDVTAIEAELDDAKRDVYRYRALPSPPPEEPVPNISLPATLDADTVEDWIARHFPATLELTDRARDALRRTVAFDDPTRVYRALEILGDAYPAMRRRRPEDDEPYRRFHEVLLRERLEYSASITPTGLGQFERFYRAERQGRPFYFDQHLKSMPRTTDKRRVLRIYFGWDDEAGTVVLGPFPAHLPNTRS